MPALARKVELGAQPIRPGEYKFTGKYNKDGTYGMVFCCPCGCGDVSSIDFIIQGENKHPRWKWNGDKNKPTLSPSLNKTNGCRWHGWLRKGEFIEC